MLTADLLVVDAVDMRASLVFRGWVAARPELTLSVAAEGPGLSAEWPEPPSVAVREGASRLAYHASELASAKPTTETAPLSERDHSAASAGAPAPFELGAPKRARADAPGAPWASQPSAAAPPAKASKQTISVDLSAARALSAPSETLGERLARELRSAESSRTPHAPPEPGRVPVADPERAEVKAAVAAQPTRPADSASAPEPAPFGASPLPPRRRGRPRTPEQAARLMFDSGATKADVARALAAMKK